MAIDIMHHKKDHIGITRNSPLLKAMFRDLILSLRDLTRQNMAGEHTPWANMMHTAPSLPIEYMDRIPAKHKLICAMEE